MKNIFQFEVMTTPCEVVIYHPSKEIAKNVALEILNYAKELEKKYNYFDPNSFVSALNNRSVVNLDPQTKDLLQKAQSFYTKTNKIFDITIATMKDLYRFSQNVAQLDQKKEELKKFVGSEHFEIKKGKLYFDNPYTKIDLGGMVKEFAVDEAVKILEKRKIKSALINFGGDIFALGKKPDGEKFIVGIKNPVNPIEHIKTVVIENEALTTSANYERGYTIEERRFSHILHTNNLQEKIISATVIGTNTLVCGVYSTALMIDHELPHKQKTILIDSQGTIQ